MVKDYLNPKKNLYIGEVPIEPLPGGALLLYRFFDFLSLDIDKIYINITNKDYVANSSYGHVFSKLNKTRFLSIYSYFNFKLLWIVLFVRLFFKLRPYTTVYTVSHGVSYKIVYRLCKIWKKNMVVFHHDLFTKTLNMPESKCDNVNKWFIKSIRKNHVHNLYVSPYMRKLYNVEGEILYPIRTNSVQENTLKRYRSSNHKMYYAGSIHSKSNYLAILNTAKFLNGIGGSLHLYSNVTKKIFENHYSSLPDNIHFNPFVDQDVLKNILYKDADSLLLVQNFEESERVAQMVNFPSKLTDYTLVGVPIVILAPKYASAAQWFSELDDKVGIHITGYSEYELSKELNNFFSNTEKMVEYGKNAQIVGKKYFSIESYSSALKNIL